MWSDLQRDMAVLFVCEALVKVDSITSLTWAGGRGGEGIEKENKIRIYISVWHSYTILL